MTLFTSTPEVNAAAKVVAESVRWTTGDVMAVCRDLLKSYEVTKPLLETLDASIVVAEGREMLEDAKAGEYDVMELPACLLSPGYGDKDEDTTFTLSLVKAMLVEVNLSTIADVFASSVTTKLQGAA